MMARVNGIMREADKHIYANIYLFCLGIGEELASYLHQNTLVCPGDPTSWQSDNVRQNKHDNPQAILAKRGRQQDMKYRGKMTAVHSF